MTSRIPRESRSGGFTILELMIAMAIIILVAMNASIVMRTGTDIAETQRRMEALNSQANRTMDRMALAIMSSSVSGIVPAPKAPANSEFLEYAPSVGFDGSTVQWGDPERIELDGGTSQVVWSSNPGTPGERRIVWSNWVSGFLEGEIENGADDNLNGLDDERGLSFDMDEDQITIRLTLTRKDDEGRDFPVTVNSRVTCRN